MNFFPSKFISTTYIPYNKKWDAFQGYILYERSGACPFNKNPFEFKDESQIVYLKPTYFSPKGNPPKDPEPYSCSWTFIGPKDYGFKLFYQKTASNINFSAVNSSGYDIIKGHGLIKHKLYYNGDNFLKINVTDRNNHLSYYNKEKWPVKNPRFFYTESYDEVIASFVSDGSIVGGGFSVNFENLDCTCSSETIINMFAQT
uniref:CUB domain-containing protein n=1 Tax=Panagrolaimus sp. PS1159 TaxID=55785 RepID=A0AC35G8M8_9BILA